MQFVQGSLVPSQVILVGVARRRSWIVAPADLGLALDLGLLYETIGPVAILIAHGTPVLTTSGVLLCDLLMDVVRLELHIASLSGWKIEISGVPAALLCSLDRCNHVHWDSSHIQRNW